MWSIVLSSFDICRNSWSVFHTFFLRHQYLVFIGWKFIWNCRAFELLLLLFWNPSGKVFIFTLPLKTLFQRFSPNPLHPPQRSQTLNIQNLSEKQNPIMIFVLLKMFGLLILKDITWSHCLLAVAEKMKLEVITEYTLRSLLISQSYMPLILVLIPWELCTDIWMIRPSGGSRTAATSKMDHFVIINNG